MDGHYPQTSRSQVTRKALRGGPPDRACDLRLRYAASPWQLCRQGTGGITFPLTFPPPSVTQLVHSPGETLLWSHKPPLRSTEPSSGSRMGSRSLGPASGKPQHHVSHVDWAAYCQQKIHEVRRTKSREDNLNSSGHNCGQPPGTPRMGFWSGFLMRKLKS